MKYFLIYQCVAILFCISLVGMDQSYQVTNFSGQEIFQQPIPTDFIVQVKQYISLDKSISRCASLTTLYNLANTCKHYHNVINPDGILLQEYADILEYMDIDTYIKAMICYADNKKMFTLLTKNIDVQFSDWIFHNGYAEIGDICIKRDEGCISGVEGFRYLLEKREVSEYIKDELVRKFDYVWRGMNPTFFTRILIHQGFDVNYQWKARGGATLLHLYGMVEKKGSMARFKNTIEFLLKQPGININAQDNEGKTSLHYFVKNPCIKSRMLPGDYLHKGGSEVTWDYAKMLLCDGRIDIHRKTNKDKTLLHYAAKYSYEILKILVEKSDTNLGSVDYKGRTVLHIASKYHNNEAVEFLLKKMPREMIHVPDNNKRSALDYAKQKLDKNKKEKYSLSKIYFSRVDCFLEPRNEKTTAALFSVGERCNGKKVELRLRWKGDNYYCVTSLQDDTKRELLFYAVLSFCGVGLIVISILAWFR